MRLIRTRGVRVLLGVLAVVGVQLAGARAATGAECPRGGAPIAVSTQPDAQPSIVAPAAHPDASGTATAPVAMTSSCSIGASLPAERVRSHVAPVQSSPSLVTTATALASFVPAPPFHPPRSI